MAQKGKFKPKHPEKYKGNPANIVWRSTWELKTMMFFDSNSNILEWSSEEIAIPYLSPIDGKYHRYFVDFWVKKRLPSGQLECTLVEVKPKSQTVAPIQGTQSTKGKRYVKEVCTYLTNQAKFAAAERYCNERNWKFILITEKELGLM